MDFGFDCQVKDLEDYYYAVHGTSNFQTYRVRNLQKCVGSNWAVSSSEINPNKDELPSLKKVPYFNRARFAVKSKLGADRVYGFQIHVMNPEWTDYTPNMHYGWRIWTEDQSRRQRWGDHRWAFDTQYIELDR